MVDLCEAVEYTIVLPQVGKGGIVLKPERLQAIMSVIFTMAGIYSYFFQLVSVACVLFQSATLSI